MWAPDSEIEISDFEKTIIKMGMAKEEDERRRNPISDEEREKKIEKAIAFGRECGRILKENVKYEAHLVKRAEEAYKFWKENFAERTNE